MKYKYLVIEGNIGAGKTSLASLLAEESGSRLVLEAFSDNPFLAKFYENPDRYAFQLELSFLSERYHQIKTELGHPDLFGQAVISDYFLAKSFIFSKYNLKDDEMKLFEKLFSIINLQAPKPDLYVYLHVPVEKLLENIKLRARSYEKHISYEYLKEVQDGYFGFFKSQQEMKILVIDTSQIDFVNRESDLQGLKKVIFEGDYSVGLNRLIL
ncbi:MAG: deoxynucleoside kinase [Bacteroidetes bacterium]|nr:MAG: deoxynucleoside kinase [Bacteroidota bacterium]